MMCVLRVYGEGFDVDAFLRSATLKPYEVYREGERRLPKSSRDTSCFDVSGFKVDVSEREWSELSEQIEDATRFLAKHEKTLRGLVAFPNVEDVRLDFPYNLRIDGERIMAQFDYFPPALLRAAGELGIGIELSLYPTDESI